MASFIFRIHCILILSVISFICYAANHDYQTAVINAALHKPASSFNALKTIHGKSVKMVVFTTYDGYTTSDTSLDATTWTTVYPDIKHLCTHYVNQHHKRVTHHQLSLWIAQMIGLPGIDAEKRKIVELDVPVIQAYYGKSPNMVGIFRPCTDPRIDNHNDGSEICPLQINLSDKNISPEFKTWFINASIHSHRLDHGFPWTEKGYTYNWNKQAIPVGISEFVVLKNTPIHVLANPRHPTTAYFSVEEYCGLS